MTPTTKTKTLVHQLSHWARVRPHSPALRGKVDGKWRTYSWDAYWTAVREVAKGLIALGHKSGDSVAIVGANRPEWVIAQWGIAAAGGIPAPGYPTNTPTQVAHILRNSEAKIAIGDTKHLIDQYRAALELDKELSLTNLVVMLDDEKDDESMTLSALRELGRKQDDAELDARIDALEPDDIIVLIYTSGTTGVAKGVQLNSRGVMAMIGAVVEHLPPEQGARILESYRSVSYLPLCHVAEQLMTNFMQLHTGGEVYFCPDMTQVKDYLGVARPTLFAGVPRVWEKFQAAMEGKMAAATGLKAKLAKWALATELAAFDKEQATGQKVKSLGRAIANKLVISKIKEAIGIQDVEMAGTAAAPISVGTLRFFASIGLVIHEWYGMSETTALVTGNGRRIKFGTVGTPLSCCQVKIAEDGEILCKGPNMTPGYLRMPEKTAELYDDEGWLHTGDLGAFDADGFLSITGRKKDILITAGGKNVAPAEMENHINQIAGVGQAVVVGDRKKYLSALITLDPENLETLAGNAGVGASEMASLAANPKVVEHLQREVERGCNAKVARFQTIKRIHVLPEPFSVDGGELTPTMKVRRAQVVEKYQGQIEGMYEG